MSTQDGDGKLRRSRRSSARVTDATNTTELSVSPGTSTPSKVTTTTSRSTESFPRACVVAKEKGWLTAVLHDGAQVSMRCAGEEYENGPKDFIAEAEELIREIEEAEEAQERLTRAIVEDAKIRADEIKKEQQEASAAAASEDEDTDDSGVYHDTNAGSDHESQASAQEHTNVDDDEEENIPNKRLRRSSRKDPNSLLTTRCRPVMLTSVADPNVQKVFHTATLATQFLGCIQSRLSTQRNTALPIAGWYVTDIPGSKYVDKNGEPRLNASSREAPIINLASPTKPTSTSSTSPTPTLASSSTTSTSKSKSKRKSSSKQKSATTPPTTTPGSTISSTGKKSGKRKRADEVVDARSLRALENPYAAAKPRARAVRIRNAFNPKETYTFLSGNLAAASLNVTAKMIASRRDDASQHCNGWFVTTTDTEENSEEITQARTPTESDAEDALLTKADKKRKKRKTREALVVDSTSTDNTRASGVTTTTTTATVNPDAMPSLIVTLNTAPHSTGGQITVTHNTVTHNTVQSPVENATTNVDGAVTVSDMDEDGDKNDRGQKKAQAYGVLNESTIVVPRVDLPPAEPNQTRELPPNLAGVAGHSGRLYAGPQNRRGRNRDYLVVKRKQNVKRLVEIDYGLRQILHGTPYDVTSMQQDKYLARDFASEDGYWYIANILGIREATDGRSEFSAFIAWPAFEEYDSVWHPYDERSIIPFESLEHFRFRLVPDQHPDSPKISYAYEQFPAHSHTSTQNLANDIASMTVPACVLAWQKESQHQLWPLLNDNNDNDDNNDNNVVVGNNVVVDDDCDDCDDCDDGDDGDDGGGRMKVEVVQNGDGDV